MPNWVQNTVKAENWETLKSVVTKLEQGKRVIDFNKVKPCPFDEELIEDGISDEKSKTLAFQTAWNMPDNIYREISKFTPIVVAYADENTGNNYGVVAYKDGQETVILDDKNKSVGESLACGFEDLEIYISNIYCDYTDEEVQEIFKTSKEKFLAKVSEDFEQTSKTISELF